MLSGNVIEKTIVTMPIEKCIIFQPAFTCSRITIETLEQGVKHAD